MPSLVRFGFRRGVVLATSAALIATACSGTPPRVVGPGERPATRNPLGARDLYTGEEVRTDVEAGVSLVPVLSRPVFIFGPAVPVSEVQVGSFALASGFTESSRLKVAPLPSPTGTAAAYVREVSRFEDRWGAIGIPAQRRIFASFAADPTLGEWLVLVSDIEVRGPSDPVPMSAYRWPREAVEAYSECGIPREGEGVPWTRLDDCSGSFYAASETLLVQPRGRAVGQ